MGTHAADEVARLLRSMPKKWQVACAAPSDRLEPFLPLIEELLPGGRAVRQLVEAGAVDAVAVGVPGQNNTRERVLVLCSGTDLSMRNVEALAALPSDQTVRAWGANTVLFGVASVVAELAKSPPRPHPVPAADAQEGHVWRAIAPGEHAISAIAFGAGLAATLDVSGKLCTRVVTPTMPLIGLDASQGEPMANGARKALAFLEVKGVDVELESAGEHAIILRFTSESLPLRTFIDVTVNPLFGRPSRWGEASIDMAEIEAEVNEEMAQEHRRELEQTVQEGQDELERLYDMGKLEADRGNYESALALFLTFFRKSRGVERWVGVRRSFLLGAIDDLWTKHGCKTAEGAVERLIIGHEETCARGEATFEDLIEWDELIHHAYKVAPVRRRLQLVDRVMALDRSDAARHAQAQVQFFLHEELLRAKRYADLFWWATGTLTDLDETEAPDADLFARSHRAFDVLAHLTNADNVRTAFETFMLRTPPNERYRRAAILVRALIKTDFTAAVEACLEHAQATLPSREHGKLAKLWASRPIKV